MSRPTKLCELPRVSSRVELYVGGFVSILGADDASPWMGEGGRIGFERGGRL